MQAAIERKNTKGTKSVQTFQNSLWEDQNTLLVAPGHPKLNRYPFFTYVYTCHPFGASAAVCHGDVTSRKTDAGLAFLPTGKSDTGDFADARLEEKERRLLNRNGFIQVTHITLLHLVSALGECCDVNNVSMLNTTIALRFQSSHKKLIQGCVVVTGFISNFLLPRCKSGYYV